MNNSNTNSVFLSPKHEAEVLETIVNLANKDSSGFDEISTILFYNYTLFCLGGNK